MSRSLTASDRASLVKLASSLPSGSAERKAILAGLSKTQGKVAGASPFLAPLHRFLESLGDLHGKDAVLWYSRVSPKEGIILDGHLSGIFFGDPEMEAELEESKSQVEKFFGCKFHLDLSSFENGYAYLRQASTCK